MKRADIEKIFEGASKEQIDAVLNINGMDVEAAKANLQETEKEIERAKESIAAMTEEMNKLKENGASAAEWQAKFEALTNEVAEKEEKAAKEKAEAEKTASIKARYAAVSADKEGKPLEWTHDAIRDSYYRKFAEAIADKNNAGKSDAEIFNALVKDDAAAFKNVSVLNLGGAKPLGGKGKAKTKEEISAIKDPIERQKAIKDNINLYITEE